MPESRSPARRWMRPVAYVAFALGAALFALALVQLATDVALLDDPWTGGVGMWLLAFILLRLSARPEVPDPP